ncbi:MAG: hypothetical protein JSS61_00775, partial [Verrucomicrobia bacterium]|nr:hypothetical protein [Verrucomicrobiota bacterium]
MKLLPLMFFCSALSAGNFPPIQSLEEIVSELKFLTDFEDQVGFAYQGTAGSLKGMTLPLSYYSTADYWAKYVGALPGNDLHVVNAYNGSDYTLTPTGNSPGKDLQVERVNVSNGTDIYDAACWQMALAVCGRSGLKGPLGEDLFTLAQNQDHLLQVGYDGNATSAEIGANRAITHADGTFEYGGEKITDHKKAYFYRMVTRNWLSTDPFLGTPYMEYIRAENLPPNPDYKPGKITWLDWKPITGENAWAFLIGPLQAAHLEQQASGRSYVPFSSAAVQNALGSLHAFSSMQSEIGALYYACKGSLGNQGGDAV